MRFCVVGAGAIGQLVGTRLALGGEEVTFIARGATLEAINRSGTTVVHKDGRRETAGNVRATDDWDAAGKFDFVLLALKAYQLPEVAPRLASLYHEGTVVVPMQNGIPFWYFHGHGDFAGRTVESADPGGTCLRTIPAERIVGCVVYVASERMAPSTVTFGGPGRLPIGELDGKRSDRIQVLSSAFAASGLEAPVVQDIRGEIWVKLWGNVTFNPISALTRAPLEDLCKDPDGRELAAQMMREAQAVGEKLGVAFRIPIEKRLEGAQRTGRHKTSMLQDVEAGRALETDALVGSVVELGELVGVATPTITAIYRSAKLLERMLAAGAFRAPGLSPPR